MALMRSLASVLLRQWKLTRSLLNAWNKVLP
jgi:hypothetical protein